MKRSLLRHRSLCVLARLHVSLAKHMPARFLSTCWFTWVEQHHVSLPTTTHSSFMLTCCFSPGPGGSYPRRSRAPGGLPFLQGSVQLLRRCPEAKGLRTSRSFTHCGVARATALVGLCSRRLCRLIPDKLTYFAWAGRRPHTLFRRSCPHNMVRPLQAEGGTSHRSAACASQPKSVGGHKAAPFHQATCCSRHLQPCSQECTTVSTVTG